MGLISAQPSTMEPQKGSEKTGRYMLKATLLTIWSIKQLYSISIDMVISRSLCVSVIVWIVGRAQFGASQDLSEHGFERDFSGLFVQDN